MDNGKENGNYYLGFRVVVRYDMSNCQELSSSRNAHGWLPKLWSLFRYPKY